MNRLSYLYLFLIISLQSQIHLILPNLHTLFGLQKSTLTLSIFRMNSKCHSVLLLPIILLMLFSQFNIIIILIFHHIPYVLSFDFAGVIVSSDSTTINVTTNYQFYFDRSVDNNGNPTAYNTNFVPAGSNVVIVFPSIYVLSSNYTCSPGSPGPTNGCTINGQNVTISGLFNTATNVTTLEIDISNVLNPSPAVTTGYFYGYIGNDAAIPINYQSYIQLDKGLFSSCSITFNPSYMNKSESMIFTIEPKNLIWNGGYIIIGFPISGAWSEDISYQSFNISSSMTCSNLTSNVSPNLVCSGNLSTKIVNITGLFSSNNIDIFSFAFANIISPPNSDVVSQDQLFIQSYYEGNLIDQCNSYVTGLTPNILPSFIVTTTPQTLTVNTANVSIKMNITLADTFKTGLNSIQIVFPSSYKLSMAAISSSFSGTFSFNSTNNTLTISTTGNKAYYSNSSINVNFNYWTVPPSIAILSAIIFNVQRNGLTTQTASSATLQPIVSSRIAITINPIITTVSTNTSYVISVTFGDPISSSGIISITFPSTIVLTFSSSNCASVTGNLTNTAPTCTINNLNTLLLTNLNSSTSVIPAQTLIITINGIQNPSTTQPSSAFNITTYYSASYDMVATVVTGNVTATPGILNSSLVSLTAGSYLVQDTNTTYTLGFNNLNVLSIGSIIQFGIPATCLASGTLNCTGILGVGTLTTQTCIASTIGQYTYINITSLLASTSADVNTTFKIALNGMFTNPPSTAPVTGFSIILFAPSGYIINQYVSGLSLTMLTPADFNSISVTHNSNKNYASNSISVTLSQPSPFSTGSLLIVYFPSTIVLQSTVTCTDLTSASVPCTFSSNTVTAHLLSNVSNTNFGLIISNVFNAPSLKPSSTFGFATLTSTGYYYSQNLASGILTNTQTSNFISLTGVFSNLMLDTSQTLTITFIPTNAITGWIIIKLASSFTLNSLGCLNWTGLCSVSSNILNISGVFNLSTKNIININGFTSPTSLPSDYTTITTYDSSGYSIDSSADTIIFVLNCTLPCATCINVATDCITCYTSTSITIYNYYYSAILSCLSSCPAGTYTDSINYLCINCSNICLTCNSSTYCLSCNKISSYPYQYKNASTQTSTCLASCPGGTYANTSQSNYFCSLCVSPCSQCLSQTYCTACITGYYFNSSGSNCLDNCTLNFTITNSSNMSCDPCASMCYTCQMTTTNCVRCSSHAALYLGTCVTTCPSPLVVNAGACTSCTNPCLTCISTATNCTSCNSSSSKPFLLNNSCIESCPTYYYNISVSGTCYNCSTLGLNCANCINSTTCSTTCDTGFIYDNGNCQIVCASGQVNINSICLDCTFPCTTCFRSLTSCLSCTLNFFLINASCVTQCLTYFYADINTNTCLPCVSPCFICTSELICSSCVQGYVLYNTLCLSTCASGYYEDTTICLACESPCQTCSSSRNCTSCITTLIPSVYLTPQFTCVLASNCPVATYANGSNYQCIQCVPPCHTCISLQICLSCIINLYLSGSICVTTCPIGQIPINLICTACIFPCFTCIDQLRNCLSCDPSANPTVYLSGNSCLQTCPSTTYPNSNNLTCINCVSPCATCTSLQICKTCNLGYTFYSNYCYSICPFGFASINQICISCTLPCLTCINSSTICLTCVMGYYYITVIHSCVTTCPSNLFINFTSQTCVGCILKCRTCMNYPNNCSSCTQSYYLLVGNSQNRTVNSTCLSICPSSYYILGSICQRCSTFCLTCISLTICTTCLSNYYLYSSNCVESCPSTISIIINYTCISCNDPNCQNCSTIDNCTICKLPYLLLNESCYQSCPIPYVSTGTFCYNPTETSLDSSLSKNNLIPIPFTIATGCIIIISFIVSCKYEQFFVIGGIFSLTSILQVLVNFYFAYLYYQWTNHNLSNPIFVLIIAALGFLYLLNIICCLIVNHVFLKDQKFQAWISSVNTKVTYVFVIMLVLFVNHKIINLLFCKLFHCSVFNAKLVHVNKLFSLHIMWIISLIYTISGISLASYHLYTNRSTKNQLYIQSIDLIIVLLLNVIFGFFNKIQNKINFKQDDGKECNKMKQHQNHDCASSNIMIYKQKSKVKHSGIDTDMHRNLSINQLIQQMYNKNNNENKLGGQLKKNDNMKIDDQILKYNIEYTGKNAHKNVQSLHEKQDNVLPNENSKKSYITENFVIS